MSGHDHRRSPRSERIVYVTGTYPLLTTTFIDREIQVLRRRGVEVDIVSARRPPSDAPLSDDQRELGSGVTYLTPIAWRRVVAGHLHFLVTRPWRYTTTFSYLVSRPHPSPRSRLRTAIHFAEGVHAAHLVRRPSARAIHAHFVDRAATLAFVMGRLLDAPYSVSIHAGADVFVDPVLLAEKIRHAESVVTCTAHNKAYIANLIGPDLGSRIESIPHGLDLHRYEPGSRVGAETPVVLAVAQLTARKGLAQLVEACAVLRDEGHRFRCRIVGTGPQAAELQRLVADRALGDVVTLCGAMPHERVLDEYRQATMFVLPCVRTPAGDVDGIPNVIAEAMALEVPVISSDLPAIRELVSHELDGLLVQPGDVAGLASAMRSLLSSPDLRLQLGRRARHTIVETFDVETNVRRFAEAMWPDEQWEVAT
jgi:colanic acid/amylovoran biosynthesis glycosyltransferase